MIIDDAIFNEAVISGIDESVKIFNSEFKNSEFSKKITGTLYNVNFENCVFKDVVFDLTTSMDITFVKCSFYNCIFGNVTSTNCRFVLCKNRINGIRFV